VQAWAIDAAWNVGLWLLFLALVAAVVALVVHDR
jgi:ABC-type multidrug transport system permease subunit